MRQKEKKELMPTPNLEFPLSKNIKIRFALLLLLDSEGNLVGLFLLSIASDRHALATSSDRQRQGRREGKKDKPRKRRRESSKKE